MIALRPEVQLFAQAMEERLRANDGKGGWRDETVGHLMSRLRDEVEELGEALVALEEEEGEDNHKITWNFAREKVKREAADVANFAMMVADVLGRLVERSE